MDNIEEERLAYEDIMERSQRIDREFKRGMYCQTMEEPEPPRDPVTGQVLDADKGKDPFRLFAKHFSQS